MTTIRLTITSNLIAAGNAPSDHGPDRGTQSHSFIPTVVQLKLQRRMYILKDNQQTSPPPLLLRQLLVSLAPWQAPCLRQVVSNTHESPPSANLLMPARLSLCDCAQASGFDIVPVIRRPESAVHRACPYKKHHLFIAAAVPVAHVDLLLVYHVGVLTIWPIIWLLWARLVHCNVLMLAVGWRLTLTGSIAIELPDHDYAFGEP